MSGIIWKGLMTLLLTLALLGCAGNVVPAADEGPLPTSTTAPTKQAEPTPTPAPTERPAPTMTVTAEPTVGTRELPEGGEGSLEIEAVLEWLAGETGLPADSFEIVSLERREWPNAGLGCPRPGEMYIAVITPGFEIQVQGAEERFEVHSNADGSSLVLCTPDETTLSEEEEGVVPTNEEPTMPMNMPSDAAKVAERALATVAEKRGIEQSELEVTSFSKEMWPDSALGCRQAGQMYMQVITPGYKFVIEGGGQSFNVHTDASGNRVILCGENQ